MAPFTNPFRDLLGIEVVHQGDGEATIAIDASEQLTQSAGVLHGGVVAALIDTGAGQALRGRIPEGQRIVTTDLSVSYLRGAKPGRVEARGRVLRQGRRVAFCSTDVVDASGAVVATGRVTALFLPED